MNRYALILLLAFAAVLCAEVVLGRKADSWVGYGSIYRDQTLYERSVP